MKTHRKKKINEEANTDRLIRNGFVAIIFCFFAAALVIWKGKLANPGSLGDAFNGLLAPFISLFAAFLIYFSFKAQIRANRMQYEANRMVASQWEFDTYLRMYQDIETSYNNLNTLVTEIEVIHGTETPIPTRYRGQKYLKHIYNGFSDFKIDTNELILPVIQLFEQVTHYIDRLEASDFKEKRFFREKILSFYNSHLEEHVKKYATVYNENDLESGTMETPWFHRTIIISGLQASVKIARKNNIETELEKIKGKPIKFDQGDTKGH